MSPTREHLAPRRVPRLARSPSRRTSSTRDPFLVHLQRTRGNRFVERLLSSGNSHETVAGTQAGNSFADDANRGLIQRQPTPKDDSGGLTLEIGEVEVMCAIAKETPILDVDTHVLFAIDSAVLTPIAVADIERFVVRWHAGGADDMVRVDAYASVDGPEEHNLSLSCERAFAVKKQLQRPAQGCPGIPSEFIEPFAHGETSAFSNALAPNRRATITADIPRVSVDPAKACGGP